MLRHCSHRCDRKPAVYQIRQSPRITQSLLGRDSLTKDLRWGIVRLQGGQDQCFQVLCTHRIYPTYRQGKDHGISQPLVFWRDWSSIQDPYTARSDFADVSIILYIVLDHDTVVSQALTCCYMSWTAHRESIHDPLLRWLW